jgi:PadR family transcriptional regulator, regulatory protein PadR
VKLSDSAYWILGALGEGDAHGYLIASRIRTLTAGATSIGPGTLYSTLERLVADGDIMLAGDEVVDGRNRRSYRLTEAGFGKVNDETHRRAAATDRVRLVLGMAR